MERDQATELIHNLLRGMLSKKSLRPVYHDRLPAGLQD